jgi:O-antigen ligase
MTGSNITNFLLTAVLLLMFIFRTDRDQKSLVFVCLLLLVIFLAKVSPQNNSYVSNYFGRIFNTEEKKTAVEDLLPIRFRPDSTLNPEERNEKVATLYLDSLYRLRNEKENKANSRPVAFIQKIEIPTADINSAPYQHKSLLTPVEENMNKFIKQHSNELTLSTDSNFNSKIPGKILAYRQTIEFFQQHPFKIITGIGIGNFSSKLAFKTTGLNIAGGYPQKFIYINEPFLKNHLDLYLNYFTKPDGFHSIANNPNSVYDQLLSEYGLLGLLAFFIFYFGFFLKKIKKLTYGIPLIIFLSGIFFVDYWFEQLSIVVFFELLLFLNMKEEVGK